jgi:two-component system chemotaxis response regulator CheB
MKQSEELESSLWFAIRSLEQKKTLLASLSEKYSKTGASLLFDSYQSRIEEIDNHISNLKGILRANLDEPEAA